MNMRRVKEDPEREERITMEVVVDAYDAGERAMGWHC
jgi:Calcium binding